MKVGLVVDGETEYYSILSICDRIKSECGVAFLRPALAEVFGEPNAKQVVRGSLAAVRIQVERGANLVVLVLDHEGRLDCPGDFARAVRLELDQQVSSRVEVVMKRTMYENWLIADPNAMSTQPGRYRRVSNADASRYIPGRADNVDALAILKRYAKGPAYSKLNDGKKLAERVRPEVVAQNSRSFRKFLRVLNHPSYREQSRQAAA